MGEARRKYSREFKMEAVRLVTEGGQTIAETARELGISKAGNRHVRGIAIQLAWAWLRYQPDSRLSRWYEERFARGGPRARKVGIVALARKLLVDLWRYLEWGVLPAGAELKA